MQRLVAPLTSPKWPCVGPPPPEAEARENRDKDEEPHSTGNPWPIILNPSDQLGLCFWRTARRGRGEELPIRIIFPTQANFHEVLVGFRGLCRG